jgi:hypothetical protein
MGYTEIYMHQIGPDQEGFFRFSPSFSFLALLTEDAAFSEGRNAEQREVVRRWLRAVRLAHREAKVTDEGPGGLG